MTSFPGPGPDVSVMFREGIARFIRQAEGNGFLISLSRPGPEVSAVFTRQVNRLPVMAAMFETARTWPSPASAKGGERPLSSGSAGVTVEASG